MKRTLNIEANELVGKEIKINGWVHNKRKMGKIIFVDVRDRGAILQTVGTADELGEKLYEIFGNLHHEDVVEITGRIEKRTKENPALETGSVELIAKKIALLNSSKTPPFEVNKDTKGISEELRLKYRYLDLRTERMAKNMRLRAAVTRFVREYLVQKDFLEVETPILTKGTPEGAREYIVPSRLYPGKFYVLPQSPQQFKQLLQVAGFERYFQIARAFRDEDQRGDRQPEHTQIDIEMSFVSEEDIFELSENMMIGLVEHLNKTQKEKWHISKIPFPRISYSESIKKYGNDKPDLRKDKSSVRELAFAWIVDFPLFERSEKEKKLVATHHLFTSPRKDDIPLLDKNPEKVFANQYDLVLNGFELASGSIRIHDKDLQKKIFDILGIDEKETGRRFGHMLEAFEYGAPPHGGIAPGLDRLVMILLGEPNIREVIAFPKTSDARDLMMGAPSTLPKDALDDVHIQLKNNI